MSSRRVSFILLLIFTCFFLLNIKLFYIQIINGAKMSRAASSQRISEANVGRLRGGILDRNGITFTDRTNRYAIVLKPSNFINNPEETQKVCTALGIDSSELLGSMHEKSTPIVIETDEEMKNKIVSLNIDGVSVVNSTNRYEDNSLAKHVTGYLNKKDITGEAGIERYYESILNFEKNSSVAVVKDAKNNPVYGIGYRFVPGKEKSIRQNIVLTLDYHIQKIVEEVMKKNNIKGAVVVENVNNGDIVAMSSKPDFSPNNVEKYLESEKHELFNRAVASYDLGSVFKIVVAACALENNIYTPQDFFCNGSINIGNKNFKCTSYEAGGHGIIGFQEAFVKSCNTYFINLGIKVGYKDILTTARKFGMGQNTGVGEQGVDEALGMLPDESVKVTDGVVANLSIGQGEILATPLQIANMIALVANGGIKNRVNIADRIADVKGNTIKSLRIDEGERVMQRSTAETIKQMMKETVKTGTGTKANVDDIGGAAGKTGTAETGQYIAGEKIVHAWFAGYYPLNNPLYSIVVLAENGKSAGQVAAPVFAEIVREIAKLN